MLLKRKYSARPTIFLLFLLTVTGAAQDSTPLLDKSKPDVSDKSSITKTGDDSSSTESGDADNSQNYRLLQSNDFLVDTAYLQEEGELQHTVPVGIGPSRGENGIFFYISFEHSLRKAIEAP